MGASRDELIAEGPEGLMRVLTDLFEKSRKDPAFEKKDYKVLYKQGTQESLVVVDASQQPFQCWHYDSRGRSATLPVRDTIQQFFQEKFGVPAVAPATVTPPPSSTYQTRREPVFSKVMGLFAHDKMTKQPVPAAAQTYFHDVSGADFLSLNRNSSSVTVGMQHPLNYADERIAEVRASKKGLEYK